MEKQQILQVLDKPDQLFDIVISNIDSIPKNLLFRSIHTISEEDINKALIIINKVGEKFTDISFLAIKIKILAACDQGIQALELLSSLPKKMHKKRFYIPIFHSLCRSRGPAFEFLRTSIYKHFRIVEEDIIPIYPLIKKNEIDTLFEIMSDNEIIVSEISFFKGKPHFSLNSDNSCKHCNNKIKKINISSDERSLLLNNLENEYMNDKIKKEIKKLDLFLKNRNDNVFLDGNNILFFIDRKVTINGFRRLKAVFDKINFGNGLIFLHRRHRDYLKKNFKGSDYQEAKKILNELNNNIYYTPYKMNDDWFFIWASLNTNNSKLITNDSLRDHIFKISVEDLVSNSLTRWINNSIIKYEINKPFSVELTHPPIISRKIQKVNKIWHIPLIDNSWLCYK